MLATFRFMVCFFSEEIKLLHNILQLFTECYILNYWQYVIHTAIYTTRCAHSVFGSQVPFGVCRKIICPAFLYGIPSNFSMKQNHDLSMEFLKKSYRNRNFIGIKRNAAGPIHVNIPQKGVWKRKLSTSEELIYSRTVENHNNDIVRFPSRQYSAFWWFLLFAWSTRVVWHDDKPIKPSVCDH